MSKAPVSHTCPDIDKCIKWLKEARCAINSAILNLDTISGIDKNNNDIDEQIYFAKQNLEEAANLIEFDRELEYLRDSNSKLRDWGYELLERLERLE